MTGETNLKPRPSKDAERTRHEILEASLKEFAKKGFDAATVRGIASRVGLSHGLIRYHFGTKEKLWGEAVAFLFARQSEELALTEDEDRANPPGSLGRLKIIIRRYVYYCARHPEHARILMQETVTPTPRMEKALRANLKPVHAAAIEEMKRHRAAGRFPKNAPIPSIMYMVSGACQNIFALAPEARVTLDYDPMTKDAIEAHADLIVATFCPDQ